ncbi:toll-like receptor 6 [Octopus sinensis]|uniref:Toll-like receptor 6 n=1 Tax=Octopus sinensis TaxID=2607531 RepID=A0A6P7T988_9MOLL|nr:toll-like receptor 6 [Octopus sinensis]XP_029646784.1 toll-like receptor 6 [Octopus sinensis]XP_036366263.1 toll-like receptor 6 [Octopus sinensis]
MLQHLLIVTWLFGATLTSYALNYSPDSINLNCFNCTYSNVTFFQLSYNNISSISITNNNMLQLNFNQNQNDSILINLGSMPNLQGLNVSNNKLLDFPYSLLSYPKWQTLDISSNGIIYLTKPIVTNSLHLHLQNNQIQELSDSLFQDSPNLEILDLSNNKLKQIKLETFSNLKNLSSLNLSKNQIQTIYGPLSLSKLNSLDLSENLIQALSKNMFSEVPLNLNELDLSHNKLTEISSDAFIQLLSLKDFSLQGNNITKSINSLRLPYHLINFDLSNCSLQEIDQCKFQNLKDIQNLNLEHNSLLCNCHLNSIINMYGSSVHIKTCRNSSEEIDKALINSLELNCKPQTCNNWNPNINSDASSNLNVSTEIEKGRVRIKWMTSLIVNQFHVSIKDSSENQLEDITLKYEHEYSFDTDSAFVTYHICVNALDRDDDVISKKCISVFMKDANIITGIVAGLLALIPCVFGLIYVTCKDRNYHRLNSNMQTITKPVQKSDLQQTNDKKVPAKLAAPQGNHNQGFQSDNDKLNSQYENVEKLPQTSVEIPENPNNNQLTYL